MDSLAAAAWLFALGTVLPHGLNLGFKLSSHACFELLQLMSLAYVLIAVMRLALGSITLGKLSSDEVASGTVI
jgi:hypothetical protein